MAYNPITTLDESIECSSIVPSLEGNGTVAEIFYSKGYRCEGRTQYGSVCRLVWTRAHQAINCASRRHRNRYLDEYSWQVTIEGRETIIEQSFVREAIRRDGARPAPVTQAPAPAPVSVTELETVKAAALALGFRLSRIPAAKAPASSPEVLLDITQDPGYVSPLEPAF